MLHQTEFNLLFHKLCLLGVEYPGKDWSNPCSHLMEVCVTRPGSLAELITTDFTCESHEFRLNGSGLKMYWRVEKTANGRKVFITIGGDQVDDYYCFVFKARELLNKLGYDKGTRGGLSQNGYFHVNTKRVILPSTAGKGG